MSRIQVGILGATGAVGQKFVELLDSHPWFEVAALVASERSAGKTYADAVNWIAANAIPDRISAMIVESVNDSIACDVVFSGLDASVATDIEASYASRGFAVISNARNYRMESNVPLLIPEVNPDHLKLIDRQNWSDGGFIVTNPNCSTVGVVSTLKPLHDRYSIEAVSITTMQALSGAGYPGVSSLDILGNVIPFIGGEEEKLESEPLKLLGKLTQAGVEPCRFPISAQCNRVPVIDGHTIGISVKLKENPDPEDVKRTLTDFRPSIADLDLPSSPERFISVFEDQRYPQPARHVMLGRGMTVSVGRLRRCPVLGLRYVSLSHNTIRGAAGGAILNAELLVKSGYIKRSHGVLNI
jgi:aspartate-semialdehyde dehydrogenase